MASKTEIANMAVSHLGASKEISDLDTGSGEDAKACRRFFNDARDKVLGDFVWPFATKFVAVGLVQKDPTTEWGFSYRYPSDCLQIRRILSGLRNDNRQTRVPYKVGRDTTGLLIYTDAEDAEIEYTIRETDPTRFPSGFVLMFSLFLAGLIAPRLTGGDPFKLGERAIRLYSALLSDAKSRAIHEEQNEIPPESEFIRER